MIAKTQILETQFAVLKADGKTGHVLTLEGDIFKSDDSIVYLIFDNIDLARIYVEKVQSENDELEFAVYNCKYELVEFYKAPKWS